MSNLPDQKDLPTSTLPFEVVHQGEHYQFAQRETAREFMKKKEGSHLQYNCVTPDVLRYEDLFDTELTDRVVKIIDGNPGLKEILVDKATEAHIEDGELRLSVVYGLLEEHEVYLAGASLRKLCINTIRGYLRELILPIN